MITISSRFQPKNFDLIFIQGCASYGQWFKKIILHRELFLMLKNRRLAFDADFNTGFEIIFERQLWLHSLFELTAAFWEFQQ